jgi:basic membrane protein A
VSPLVRPMLPLLALILAACSGAPEQQPGTPAEPAPAADPTKVAFLYVGPVGDAGWSWAHDEARKDLEEHFPWVESTYMESVPEGAGAVRVLTQFAEKGYDLVFATSFGYMDPVIEVAGRYPDMTFMHCSGYKRADNVGTYFGRMYQPKYLSGIIAGRVSESDKIGYVAPHPIPEVIRHINAFALGVRAVNPEATVHVVWTNSWFDPGKEKEAATSLLDAGADVIATGADSAAPMQAAEAHGAFAIGYDSDGRQFAPKAFLTAPIWDWSVIYREVVQQVRDGTWQSSDYWNGVESGVVKLAPMSDLVPAEVQAQVVAQQQAIVDGELVVFAGPWSWQDGSQAYAEGAVPSDKELLEMKRFVQGVVGNIPE